MVWKVRRVITGHDKDGKSVFLSDGHAPNVKEMESMPGLALTDLWETTAAPASNAGDADAADRRRAERFCASSSFRRTRLGATMPTPARRSSRSAPATRLSPTPTTR